MSKAFYLKYSSLEESLPLVDVGWGKNQPVKPWGPVLSGLVQTFSAEQGILGEWGFLSSHQDGLLRLHSPLKPRLPHERGEHACTHQSPGDSLRCPFAGRYRYLSHAAHPHPTPSTESRTTYSSPGLPSYSKPPIVCFPKLIYVPSFMTFDIFSSTDAIIHLTFFFY